MDLRTLRYFISVYEELSLSGAAKRCFVAQPSISTAMLQLEKDLKRQLFIRHSKGVSPTQAANALFPYAQKVLNDIQKIQDLFQEQTAWVPLKIAIMPFVSGERISQIIKKLLDTIKGLDLSIADWNEEADARIISSTMVLPNETFHKLWRDKYVLALPKEHPLTVYESIRLKQIDNLPFISRTFCDALDSWHFAIQDQGIRINTKATLSNEEYALDLVAAGLGISLVPSHSADRRPDLETRDISDVKLERIVGLACKIDHPLPLELLTTVDNFMDDIESPR
ncbi:MAG: LysR family transcriptional regulator [Desulfuromusa sp.]|jgi:DNA-binding transcriptional LysR family regulator|nr:LysR family transcriptional regulator [Desulfuromusa sp.]